MNMKFQMPDVKATLEGISSLMENDIEKKVEVSAGISSLSIFITTTLWSRFSALKG